MKKDIDTDSIKSICINKIDDVTEKDISILRGSFIPQDFFSLQEDPDELVDLVGDAGWNDVLGAWRERLIRLLAERPQDGLSDGKKLIAGRRLPAVRILADPFFTAGMLLWYRTESKDA